jgi:hypothetical protein
VPAFCSSFTLYSRSPSSRTVLTLQVGPHGSILCRKQETRSTRVHWYSYHCTNASAVPARPTAATCCRRPPRRRRCYQTRHGMRHGWVHRRVHEYTAQLSWLRVGEQASRDLNEHSRGDTVQYTAVQCSGVEWSTVQYSTVQCSAVQCSACAVLCCAVLRCASSAGQVLTHSPVVLSSAPSLAFPSPHSHPPRSSCTHSPAHARTPALTHARTDRRQHLSALFH